MSLEQLIYDNVIAGKTEQAVVEKEDQAIIISLLADFVSSMVTLSGYQLTKEEIVARLRGLETIRFTAFQEEKIPHGITISLESPVHSVYQLNLGLLEEIFNDKSIFSFHNKDSLEEQVGSTCYQGIIHDMAERLMKESYPSFPSSSRRESCFWAESEIMGVLIDVIGEETFFTNIVRNPRPFFRKMNRITYQEEPLCRHLATRLQEIKSPSDIATLVTNATVLDCVEAISESQEQLTHQFTKYK